MGITKLYYKLIKIFMSKNISLENRNLKKKNPKNSKSLVDSLETMFKCKMQKKMQQNIYYK